MKDRTYHLAIRAKKIIDVFHSDQAISIRLETENGQIPEIEIVRVKKNSSKPLLTLSTVKER